MAVSPFPYSALDPELANDLRRGNIRVRGAAERFMIATEELGLAVNRELARGLRTRQSPPEAAQNAAGWMAAASTIPSVIGAIGTQDPVLLWTMLTTGSAVGASAVAPSGFAAGTRQRAVEGVVAGVEVLVGAIKVTKGITARDPADITEGLSEITSGLGVGAAAVLRGGSRRGELSTRDIVRGSGNPELIRLLGVCDDRFGDYADEVVRPVAGGGGPVATRTAPDISLREQTLNAVRIEVGEIAHTRTSPIVRRGFA